MLTNQYTLSQSQKIPLTNQNTLTQDLENGNQSKNFNPRS